MKRQRSSDDDEDEERHVKAKQIIIPSFLSMLDDACDEVTRDELWQRCFCVEELDMREQMKIIIEAHHTTRNINTVCKKWYWAIHNDLGWFDVARARYGAYLDHIPRERMLAIDLDCERVFAIILGIEKCPPAFRSYVGLMMNAKYLAVIKENEDGTPRASPIVRSIADYLETYKDNLLTQRTFDRRDFYLNFEEKNHTYTLICRGTRPGDGFRAIQSTRDEDDNEEGPLDRYFGLVDTKDGEEEEEKRVEDTVLRSATTFIHELFPVFDADKVVKKMRKETREAKYKGMSNEEIKAFWIKHNNEASEAGSAMHRNLEMYYIGRPHVTDTREFWLFDRFEEARVRGKLRPYRTEWTMYSHVLHITGAADIIYEYVDDDDDKGRSSCIIIPEEKKKHVVLMDWKRSKEIRMTNPYRGPDSKGCVACTGDLDNCNYVQYAIQQALYKYILESEYNLIVDAMYLVILHPNQDDYMLMEIVGAHIGSYMERIIQYRRDWLDRKLRKPVPKRQREEDVIPMPFVTVKRQRTILPSTIVIDETDDDADFRTPIIV